VLALTWRPDALAELLEPGPEDAIVRAHEDLLFTLLDSYGDDDLASARVRVAFEQPHGETPEARDARLRRRFSLAGRDALLHPR
jgi:hypothetical protein